MSGHSDLVVGWCPGALRPMASGDGLIVRVRPRLGAVSLMQLDMLATAARRFGDGNLYLSNRANVQIRGVTGEEHCALLDVLAAANLMDSDPRIEAVRNVMLVPALGPGACPGTAGDSGRQTGRTPRENRIASCIAGQVRGRCANGQRLRR